MGKRVVVLQKPFTFEGKEYKTVDLGGLENLSTVDLIEVQRVFQAQNIHPIIPEIDYSQCCMLAARATKLPYEFFLKLPANDGASVKNVVSNFLFNVG
ncbi:phage tail assembly protein [Intestinibacillus massiliensis]|uniref:phage tail assembly protein n=1 Tax=Intestinibacillus massiliensis TaxID=1871029 RepID=UPI000B34B76E|nr:phage tail assembly protein [Intestinibacillus massiliensis]